MQRQTSPPRIDGTALERSGRTVIGGVRLVALGSLLAAAGCAPLALPPSPPRAENDGSLAGQTAPLLRGEPTLPPPELSALVATMPAEAQTSIRAVGTYIRAHEADPIRRVKALHDWVAEHIAYDTAESKPDGSWEASYVFEHRRGVCAGYARLLVALGEVTGDPIEYVAGDGHAWNVVEIAGFRIVIDATADAGYVDGGVFHRQYSSRYFKLAGQRPLVSPGEEPPLISRHGL
jgi:hypothetical protein